MNKLKIEYTKPRRFLTFLLGKTKRFSATVFTPSNWDELAPKHLVQASQFALSDLSFEQKATIKRQMIIDLTGVKWKHLKHINNSQLAEIANSLNFIFDEFNRITMPFSSFPYKNSHLIGPGDKLNKLTFAQFIYADTAYIDFINTKKFEHIYKIAASLYKPVDGFNSDDINQIAKHFESVSVSELLSIFIFYVSCKKHLQTLFPHFFPQQKETQKAPKVEKIRNPWADIFISLVGTNPASKSEIEKLDLYFILKYLDNLTKN